MNVDRTSTPKFSIAATGITMVEPENVEIRKVESIHDVIQGSACWQSHEVADGAKKRNRFLSTHRTSRIPCEMPDTRPCLTSAPSSSTLEKVLVTDQEDKSSRQGWKAARDRQFLLNFEIFNEKKRPKKKANSMTSKKTVNNTNNKHSWRQKRKLTGMIIKITVRPSPMARRIDTELVRYSARKFRAKNGLWIRKDLAYLHFGGSGAQALKI